MFNLLITLIIIISVLIVLAVLIQNSKQDGMGDSIANMSGNRILGVNKTVDMMERITKLLIISLLVLVFAVSLVLKSKKKYIIDSPNINRAKEQIVIPSEPEKNEKSSQLP